MVMVKEIFSPSRTFKAVIERLDDGNHEVSVFKFTHEVVPGYGEVCAPFWESVSRMKTLAGTLPEAERIAAEELVSLSGEEIAQNESGDT